MRIRCYDVFPILILLAACSSKPKGLESSFHAKDVPVHYGNFDLKQSFEPSPGLKVYEYVHVPTGMKAYLAPKPEIGIVSVVTSYNVGSRFESKGRTGLAHLFEHMMFRGTVNFPNPFQLLSGWGNKFNAYTGQDLTLYYEIVPKEKYPEAMAFEAERMRKLSITKEGFNTERGAVVSERKMRTEDSPMGKLRWEMYQLAFDRHPYKYNPIGLQKDLDATTFEEAIAFYRRFYAPNRAVLSYVGDFKVSELLKELEKNYGSFTAEKWVEPVLPQEPLRKDARRRVVPMKVESVYLDQAYLGTTYQQKEGITDILMCTLLTDAKLGFLTYELVETGLARGVMGDCGPAVDRSLNEIIVIGNPGVNAAKLETAFDKARGKFLQWLTPERVEKAKLFYLVGQLDTLRDPANMAEEFARNATVAGDPLYGFEVIKKIQKVTFEEIKKRYQSWELNPTRVILQPQVSAAGRVRKQ